MALLRRSTAHGQIFSRILRQNNQDRRSLTSDNISVIRKEFTKQAAVFENRWNQRMKRDNKEIMGWVLEQVGQVSNEMRALDVASGTGIFARALAPLCSEVVALDATEAMLTEAKAKAEEENLFNIKFIHGDATSLPFPNSSFGLVTSRLAIHHFTKPRPILNEMARVTAPGGRVVLVDLVASEDQEQVATLPVDMDLENWLESTGTKDESRKKVREALASEVRGGLRTGMGAHKDADGRICFTHNYALLVGRKA